MSNYLKYFVENELYINNRKFKYFLSEVLWTFNFKLFSVLLSLVKFLINSKKKWDLSPGFFLFEVFLQRYQSLFIGTFGIELDSLSLELAKPRFYDLLQ